MFSTSAIIVAAGEGKRFNRAIPKQYLLLNNHPVLYYTVKKFMESKFVNEIILVIAGKYLNKSILTECIPKGSNKQVKIAIGGKTRQDSVYSGLQNISEDNNIISIHDGVRPFVKSGQIDQSIKMCENYDGVVLAIPCVDTLKKVEDFVIVDTVDRGNIWQVQTPQTFRREVIIEAFKKARQDNFTGKDEASLVERLGAKIGVIEGSRENIKITLHNDLKLAEAIIKYWEND
jgi:2-C-methyl-D-erythritol 4-phosphate cytidylyltransferase